MMKKIKIAILADFPWGYFEAGAKGRGGGQAATWLSQLADEFCHEKKYEFHWVTLDRSKWIGSTQCKSWGGQFFHLIPAGKASLDLKLNYSISSWLLRRALRNVNPQLLHVWGTERSYPIISGWRNIPTVLSMQGILTEYQRIGSFLGDQYWSNVAKWEPKFLRAADIITAESEWGIARVNEVVDGLRIRQVEYGVNPSFYNINWDPDKVNPYALYSGSIDSRKGVDILVNSISQLPDRGWTLRIAGDGPLLKELQKRNISGVEWLGLLPWDELQRQLAHAMCLVLPTRADTSPNVSKEARVIGLPVVTTIHGGQAGYIHHKRNGLIVNPLNSDNLATALNCIMSDEESAKAMGAYRHNEDRAYFRPEETANRFIQIYKELLIENKLL